MSPPDHKSHGFPYEEPERHNALSTGVAEQPQASDDRKPGGQLVKGASTVPSLGGKAHKGKTYLSHRIVAGELVPLVYAKDDDDDAEKKLRRARWVLNIQRARVLRNALRREIAASVGGGVCGVAASLFIKFAAQKTAASEQAFTAGDFEAHRRLSESARMDILYAREHAAKEAEANAKKRPATGMLAEMFPRKETSK